jgi:formylglycine-generating enzyme required for sulfatase activity
MTRGQWVRASGAPDPSHWTAETSGGRVKPEVYFRHPVEMVSWEDSLRVLARVGLDLPTEAQWERGCRGGTDSAWSFGDDKSAFPKFGNVADRQYARTFSGTTSSEDFDDGHVVTAPVGSFAPNPFGLHDVHGNVWEWCRDVYASYEGGVHPETGERRPSDQGPRGLRVYRGGGCVNPAVGARSASRRRYDPSFRSTSLGCRPAARVTTD